MKGEQVTLEGKTPALSGPLHVVHTRNRFDVYGGRAGGDDERGHLGNTEPPERGWLGNPHEMRHESVAERRRVIRAYARDFLQKVERNDEFREAVDGLQGQRVACWCRGSTEDREPSNWCHLDVVAAYLSDSWTPLLSYLDVDARADL